MEKIYLDRKGYERVLEEIDLLKQKLNRIKKDKGEIVSIEAGNNVSESPEFGQTKLQEFMIMAEIDRLYEKLERIEIVEKTDDENVVDIDDQVTIEVNFFGEREICTVVLTAGEIRLFDEGCQNKISINSPMGSAIYKKKVGDITSYKVKKNEFEVRILKKVKLDEIKKLTK